MCGYLAILYADRRDASTLATVRAGIVDSRNEGDVVALVQIVESAGVALSTLGHHDAAGWFYVVVDSRVVAPFPLAPTGWLTKARVHRREVTLSALGPDAIHRHRDVVSGRTAVQIVDEASALLDALPTDSPVG